MPVLEEARAISDRIRKAGEAMKIDRFYQALVARRARAALTMVATMVVISS
ncbi:MAG: hypothetical protein RL579_1043, partial [Actinomycetota bacterium]